jgi:hypothetical protein
MTNAKRLAELMRPEKLLELADGMVEVVTSGGMVLSNNARIQIADILREVAARPVIEVDTTAPKDCSFFDYEQGYCFADGPRETQRSCSGDIGSGGAPEWCPARHRAMLRAKPQE